MSKPPRSTWRQRLKAPGLIARLVLTAACVVAALLQVHGIVRWPGVASLERALYDMRLQWLAPPAQESRIVVVDIDEASLAQFGHWPWSRQRVAELVDRLVRERGAAVVAFDMVFAEPTAVAGREPLDAAANALLRTNRRFAQTMRELMDTDPAFAQAVRALKPTVAPDDALAQSLAKAPVVLGYYLTSDRGGSRFGQLPEPIWRPGPGEKPLQTTAWTGYGANIPVLAQAASSGFFNAVTDADGLVRRLPLVASLDGGLYESLALRAYRLWAGFTSIQPVRASPDLDPLGTRLQALDLSGPGVKTQRVPVDAVGAAWVGLRGHGGPRGGGFTYVSAASVLKPGGEGVDLRGKIVLIGTSAPGLQDVRATPMAEVYPGVQVHASLIADLMRDHVVAAPPEADALGWLMVVGVGLLLLVFLPRAGALAALVWSGALVLGLLALGWWAHVAQAWVLPLAPPVALVLVVLLLNMAHGFFAERRLRRLTDWFGSYLPRTLVREMSTSRQTYDMHADYRNMTVLFCDIRGFTGIAERLDPTQLQSLLNQVLSTLTDCVGDARGTLDKYMGDSVMAFWGAPVATDEHARLAVSCGQAMIAAIAPLNRSLSKQGLPTVAVGVGIATGEMFVGDMGSTKRRSYTVVGDTVNVAARLEGLSKTYGVPIVVSQSTATAAPDADWQLLDHVRVRGRQQSEAIYGLKA
jgi:adenylate cyclase